MILVEFMKSTWTDVLAISIMLWATASAVYLVLRSSL
jgi:hypothetical protein